MGRKYINLPDADRRKYVYRFICLERLYDLFKNGQNVLRSPAKWDDPFENFLLRSGRLPRQGWFGQCWTRHRASDAMWRIYSTDSRGVRMRSTPSRLVETLCRSIGADSRGFIGAVDYPAEKRLISFYKSTLSRGRSDDVFAAAKTLLVKRRAFRHEGEIRLLLFRNSANAASDHENYSVDPHRLIDQLMLDPRMAKKQFHKLREEIRERTRFRGQIKRSLLYALPPSLVDPGF